MFCRLYRVSRRGGVGRGTPRLVKAVSAQGPPARVEIRRPRTQQRKYRSINRSINQWRYWADCGLDCAGGLTVRWRDGRCYDRDDDELVPRCSWATPPPPPPADVAAPPAEPLAAAGVWALTNDRLLNSLYQPIAMLARSSESSLIWTTPMNTLRSERP